MSNAPDRLDGFHTYNICCRHRSDTGRHTPNMQTYSTDRRVFKHWASGDWIAADRMMGQIRSKLRGEHCVHGHSGPCDADHIGPISSGFCHRPCFQMLCSSCNSAKNNRLSQADVSLLIAQEAQGEKVISWHTKSVWDARKGSMSDDETAGRLSKLLRENRHALMHCLQQISKAGHYSFLLGYLELHYADSKVEFRNLRVEDHITRFDEEIRTPRTTQYAATQKVRRIRIAFQDLEEYHKKENRNTFLVSNLKSEAALRECLGALAEKPHGVAEPSALARSDPRLLGRNDPPGR